MKTKSIVIILQLFTFIYSLISMWLVSLDGDVARTIAQGVIAIIAALVLHSEGFWSGEK